jgi:uncharacterized protein YqgV (UPF0045/DUF77 family)
MKIQAELSLYPLKTEEISSSIDDFLRALAQKGISIDPGQMSTVASGESGALFRAISESFEEVAELNEIVLIAKFSNACPLSRKEIRSND